MAFIEATWERYFEDTHEGLGTTYERFVLHRFFKRICATYDINRVLEAPSFGMTGVSGINSLWWAAQGAETIVLDDNPRRAGMIRRVWEQVSLPVTCLQIKDFGVLPLKDRSFDLSWNFSALGLLENPEACLVELARVTRRILFVCLPNERGIAATVGRRAGGKGRANQAISHRTERVLSALGWRIAERGYLDIPPWPDIAMNKEDFLRKIGLGRLVQRAERSTSKRLCILDYFSGLDPSMESKAMRYAFLEHAPLGIKALMAHHRYILFVPRCFSDDSGHKKLPRSYSSE